MAETVSNHDEYINRIDVKGDKVADSINENLIKEQARKYVESRVKEGISGKDYEELLHNIKTLLERQDIERLNIREELEKQVVSETQEDVDKEALIQEAKIILYEKLGISENQTKNSKTENFLKGIVDVLVIDNYDLAIEIYETNGKIIIDALKALMSWEGIKQMAEAIGESFMSLFTGNAYEKGKAVGELGLITTGIGITAVVGRKALKVGMREIIKLRANKERIVSSPEIKGVIADTNRKVKDIVPKKQVDFDKMLVEDIAKLGDKERLEAGSFYLKGKKFTPEQEKSILEAHNVGFPNKEGKFDIGDLRKKYIILEKAGFNDNEIRTLMEKGVCGKEKLPSLNSLYSHPKYSFLEKYKEVLGENLSLDDVVGEGQNAVIITNKKDPGYVVKVAKDKKGVDNLNTELANHKIFYNNYIDGLDKGSIGNNILIPKVKDLGVDGLFLIQKIEGETLYSQSVRKVLQSKGIQLEKGMSDKAIDSLVDTKYSYLQGEINKQAYKDLASTLGINHFDEVLGLGYYLKSDIDNPILNAMRYIKEHTLKGLIHNDLHSGNIMINGDKIYIIDYGKVKETK